MYNMLEIAELFIDFGNNLRTAIEKQEDLKNTLVNNEKNKFLTQQEVLEVYSPIFTRDTLYKAANNGLPYMKHGQHRYYNRRDVDKWIEEHKVHNKISNKF